MVRLAAVVAAVLALAACGSPRAGGQEPPAAAPAAMATPLPEMAVAEAPVIAAPAAEPAAPVVPATMTVSVGALPAGTYTVHLHTICSGGTQFHITTIGFVQSGGAVTLPTADFGRGWCLVVYTDPSATRAVAYRPI